jgi:hypothetical protein
LLVSWYAGDRCNMVGSDKDCGKSRDLVQRTGDGQAQVRYSVVRRSRGEVMLCAVCIMHKALRSTCFLVEPQNHWDGLSMVWPQNHWDGLSMVWPQNHWDGISQFGLKTGGDGLSWFGLKIGGGGFSGLGLKIGSYGLVIWASKLP